MNNFFKQVFVNYVMPIISISLIAIVFIGHFYFEGNQYFKNYGITYTIVMTLVFIFFSFIAFIVSFVSTKQYNEEEIENLRLSNKRTFVRRFIFRPIMIISYIGLFLTGHFWLGIMFVLTIFPSKIIMAKHKRILADYDKNIKDQSEGKLPLNAEYEVLDD